MTLKEFAEYLDGITYEQIINNHLDYAEAVKKAIENGFVIAFCASDDLFEFNGAYYEEASGVFDGGIITFDSDGTSDDGKEHSNTIKAYWCGQIDGEKVRDYTATWEYETDIPHETFGIYEDSELFCIGIVFDVKDMK